MLKTFFVFVIFFCCVSLAFAQSEITPAYIVSFEAAGMTFYRYDGLALQEVARFAEFGLQGSDLELEWRVLSIQNVTVAPDQAHIAFTAGQNEDAALFIYTIADGSLQQQSIESNWLMPLWSPDSGAVFLKTNTFYYRDSGEIPMPHGYVYEIVDATLTEIYPRSTRNLFAWLPDSSGLVYNGSCLSDECLSDSDIWFWTISRDGLENNSAGVTTPPQAFRTYEIYDLPDSNGICNFTWSPFDEQWYYEYGCLLNGDGAVDSLIASHNGLELDLSHFQINPAERYSYYRNIVDIVPASDAVYAFVESYFYLADDYRGSWRIFRIDSVPGLEIIYESPAQGTEPQFASLSPDNRLFALVGNNGIWIIDLESSEIITSTEIQAMPHAAKWQDNRTLLYDTFRTSRWGEIWQFNLETGENIRLIGDREQPAWLINANDVNF